MSTYRCYVKEVTGIDVVPSGRGQYTSVEFKGPRGRSLVAMVFQEPGRVVVLDRRMIARQSVHQATNRCPAYLYESELRDVIRTWEESRVDYAELTFRDNAPLVGADPNWYNVQVHLPLVLKHRATSRLVRVVRAEPRRRGENKIGVSERRGRMRWVSVAVIRSIIEGTPLPEADPKPKPARRASGKPRAIEI